MKTYIFKQPKGNLRAVGTFASEREAADWADKFGFVVEMVVKLHASPLVFAETAASKRVQFDVGLDSTARLKLETDETTQAIRKQNALIDALVARSSAEMDKLEAALRDFDRRFEEIKANTPK